MGGVRFTRWSGVCPSHGKGLDPPVLLCAGGFVFYGSVGSLASPRRSRRRRRRWWFRVRVRADLGPKRSSSRREAKRDGCATFPGVKNACQPPRLPVMVARRCAGAQDPRPGALCSDRLRSAAEETTVYVLGPLGRYTGRRHGASIVMVRSADPTGLKMVGATRVPA